MACGGACATVQGTPSLRVRVNNAGAARVITPARSSEKGHVEQLLASAEFQALAPFAAALLIAAVLRPWGGHWSGLAIAGAVAVLVALTIGFTFPPINSNQKIVTVILAAAAIGLLWDMLSLGQRLRVPLSILLAVGALVWILWRPLQSKSGTELWIMAGGGAVFVAWCVAVFDSLRHDVVRGAAATLVGGVAVAVTSVLGASGFYGQLAGSVAAAGGAMLLLAVLAKPAATGSTFMLPAAAAVGILGYASTVFAQTPWKVLPAVALVPLLARVPLPGSWRAWLRALVLVLICASAAVAAILLARGDAGASSMGGY